jgi:hypothetical protein
MALHRGRRHAGGQQLAVAVEDAAAAGRQLQRVGEALLALLLVEVGADDLHVDRTAEQQQEAQPTSATTKRERQGGVLLASSGLVA